MDNPVSPASQQAAPAELSQALDHQFIQDLDWASFEEPQSDFQDTSQLFQVDNESEKYFKQLFPLTPASLQIEPSPAKRSKKRKGYEIMELEEEDDDQARMERRELPQNEITLSLIILGIDVLEREKTIQKNIKEILMTKFQLQPVLLCRCATFEEYWRATFSEQSQVEKIDGLAFDLVSLDGTRVIHIRFRRPVLFYLNGRISRKEVPNPLPPNSRFTLTESPYDTDREGHDSPNYRKYPGAPGQPMHSPHRLNSQQRSHEGFAIWCDQPYSPTTARLMSTVSHVINSKLIEGIPFFLVSIKPPHGFPYNIWIENSTMSLYYPQAIQTWRSSQIPNYPPPLLETRQDHLSQPQPYNSPSMAVMPNAPSAPSYYHTQGYGSRPITPPSSFPSTISTPLHSFAPHLTPKNGAVDATAQQTQTWPTLQFGASPTPPPVTRLPQVIPPVQTPDPPHQGQEPLELPSSSFTFF